MSSEGVLSFFFSPNPHPRLLPFLRKREKERSYHDSAYSTKESYDPLFLGSVGFFGFLGFLIFALWNLDKYP